MRYWIKSLKRVGICVLIFGAMVLTAKVIRRNFFPQSYSRTQNQTQRQPQPQSPPGVTADFTKKIIVPGVDWLKSERTLVLVLDKGCRFCQLSAPFYQRLVRETAAQNKVKLLAVFPHDTKSGEEYLKQLSIDIPQVKQISLQALGLKGTPTLMLVDKQGVVNAMWVGRIPPAVETSIIERILKI